MELIEHNDILLTSYQKIASKKISETISLVRALISDYELETEKLKERNKTQSIFFNPLRFFELGETMHSFLIANLLNPHAEHGQGNLFLKTFLKPLNIEVSEKDSWTVTAEIGRIDILIKRRHPNSVIVVENKSNYAEDQAHQLYRYWHQEIYLPNLDIYGDKTVESTTNNNNFQLIYLTPSHWKLPSENSMKKPNDYEASLPDFVPIKPKVWVFKWQIVEWLTDSIQELHEDNHRLREYLKQYIELWK